MKRIYILLLLGVVISGCGEKTPTNTPTTPTPTTTISPLPPSPTITSTEIPKLQDIYTFAPLNWPLPHPSDAQLEEVRDCDIEETGTTRYSENLTQQDLFGTYPVKTGCDWAVLAYVYAQRIPEDSEDEPLQKDALIAFQQTLSLNPAFALKLDLLLPYYDENTYVENPAFTENPVSQVTIYHTWGGAGSPVEYTLEIKTSESSNTATYTLTVTLDGVDEENDTTSQPTMTSGEIDYQLIENFSLNLTNLIPINEPITKYFCAHSYPYWNIDLKYKDGKEISVSTYGSNFLPIGGPWQATIDDELYLQYSVNFMKELIKIIEELQLPLGEPSSSTCYANDILFDLAFKTRLFEIQPTPTNRPGITKTIRVGEGPWDLAWDGQYLWVINAHDNTVMKIDPISGQVLQIIDVGQFPNIMVYGGGSIWVHNHESDSIMEIDPQLGEVVQTIGLPGYEEGYVEDLVWGGENLWAAHHYSFIKINPDNGEITYVLKKDEISFFWLAWDGLSIWTHDSKEKTLLQIDPNNSKILHEIYIDINVFGSVLFFADDKLWIIDRETYKLTQINPQTGEEILIQQFDTKVFILSWDGVYLWLNKIDHNSIIQFDPVSKEIIKEFHVGESPGALVFIDSSVWVANLGENTIMQIIP